MNQCAYAYIKSACESALKTCKTKFLMTSSVKSATQFLPSNTPSLWI